MNVIWYTDSSFKRQSAQHSNSALLTKGPPWKGSTERSEMKDNLIQESDGVTQRLCLKCGTQIFGRPNKRFCSSNCRKSASKLKQNSQTSKSKRQENTRLFERAQRLAELLYSTSPNERLGFMKELIDVARSGKDNHLRLVLTNYMLLHPHPINDDHLFHRGSHTFCTIAQAANNYCKRFWQADVKKVVYNKVPEPETGELH